jgi:hypothetical protein
VSDGMPKRDQALPYEDSLADRLDTDDLFDGVTKSVALRIPEKR